MKKILLAVFALSVFAACNNDKKADKVDTTTTTTTTPVATGWKESDKKEFMDKCVEGSKAQMGDEKASAYCSCMLGKIETKYPVADSASSLSMNDMMDMAKGCLGQ